MLLPAIIFNTNVVNRIKSILYAQQVVTIYSKWFNSIPWRSYNTRIFPTVLAISHIHVKDILHPLLSELGSSLKSARFYKPIIADNSTRVTSSHKERDYRRNVQSERKKGFWWLLFTHERMSVNTRGLFHVQNRQTFWDEQVKPTCPLSYRHFLSDMLYKPA